MFVVTEHSPGDPGDGGENVSILGIFSSKQVAFDALEAAFAKAVEDYADMDESDDCPYVNPVKYDYGFHFYNQQRGECWYDTEIYIWEMQLDEMRGLDGA